MPASRKSPHPPTSGAGPRAEARLSGAELAAAAGISAATLLRLVRLGLVEPAKPGASEFTAATAARLRKMLRLHTDFGVELLGAAIILDLIERLERLDAELARLRSRAPHPGGSRGVNRTPRVGARPR